MLARLLSLAALVAAPVAAFAGTPPCTNRVATSPSWQPPLDRLVAFHAADVSLREALDRLAAAGRFRLSYSSDELPLDRRVCVSTDSAAAGDLLNELLSGTTVGPVVTAPDHVVLSPGRTTSATASRPAVVMDRIVVTGSAAGGAQRPLAIALDVIDGRTLGERQASTLSEAFNGAVPGMWMWEQSPTSVLARYGSIRGASSFGLSYPKAYIDGIEVANPLLLTRFVPDAIDRVEVIRGPHGAAMYGADAISGVTNIVTRLDAANPDAPRARLSTGTGWSASEFADPALRQEYGARLRLGSNTRSFGLNAEAGSDGAFVPGAYARRVSAGGLARVVGSRTIWTATARFYGEEAGAPISPILIDSLAPGRRLTRVAAQSVVQYTLGGSVKIVPDDRWKHNLVAGVDGYALDGVLDDRTPIPSAADSALRDARGGAARWSFRFSSVRRLVETARTSADVTISAEQSLLRQRSTLPAQAPGPGPGPGGPLAGQEIVQWRNTSGLSALTSAMFFNHLFLTGGLRGERSTGSEGVLIPMAGAAVTADRGSATVKLRGAYGKGIRWPETTARGTLWEGVRPDRARITLEPEEQSGLEGGIDLSLGNTLLLSVTRFDQTASGLIQRVTITGDTTPNGPGSRRVGYTLQNVGEISNHGWELQAAVASRGFSLSGALSFVDSRVQQLANGYTGDLAVGDRMLEVPARTMSLTAGWSGLGWSASVTAYRAEDWINYDRLALTRAFVSDTGRAPRDFVGTDLRRFWREYPGVTHLRAGATRVIGRGLTLVVAGDNLLNKQSGEPDNITVLPGRTFSFGLKGEF